METHIRARWLLNGAVVEVVPGNRAASSSHMVAQTMWNRALLCEVPPHCTILALA